MSGWWWVFLFHSLVRNIEIWNWQSWSTRTIRNWSSWDKDREERRGVQVCAPFDRSSSHTRHRIAEINQRKISVFDKNACIIVEITTHLHTANRVLSNDRDALTWFRMMVKFKRLDHHITTSLSIVLDPRNHKRRENHQNDVSITLNHQDVSLHPIKSEKYFIESSINLSKKSRVRVRARVSIYSCFPFAPSAYISESSIRFSAVRYKIGLKYWSWYWVVIHIYDYMCFFIHVSTSLSLSPVCLLVVVRFLWKANIRKRNSRQRVSF